MTIEPASREGQSALRTWAPLVAVCLAFFVVVVDSTMMNVAVSAIAKDLNTNVSAVQAAISIYSMVMASLMLTGGKLGDIFGVKRMFIVGVAVYGVGTLLAAVSWNIGVLILGWSIIEGVGAALILPLSFSLLFSNYSGSRRATAFGLLGGVQASAAAVGPILGGFLTSFLTWRLGFGGQVVVVLLIFALVGYLRESEKDEEATLDWVGTILSVVALASIVLGFILAGRYGFWEAKRTFEIAGVEISPLGLSITPLLVGFGLVVAAGFLHWQWRRENRGDTPLVRLQLFKKGGYVLGVGTDSLRQVFLAGFFFIMPVFMQSALGFSAIRSGVALLPVSGGIFVLSLATAGLGSRMAAKWIVVAGLALMGVGALLYHEATSLSMGLGDMIIPGLVFGTGAGLFVGQIVNLTLSTVTADERNEASGAHNTLRELGSSLGTAVIGSILLTGVFSGVVSGVLRAEQIELPAQQEEALAVDLEDAFEQLSEEEQRKAIEALPQETQQSLTKIVDVAVVDAQKTALLAIAGVIFLALLAATFLPRTKVEERPQPVTHEPGRPVES